MARRPGLLNGGSASASARRRGSSVFAKGEVAGAMAELK
jgi:hypothetical protein